VPEQRYFAGSGRPRWAEQQLAAWAEAGRVVVRFSGTEPLARVMIEAGTQEEVDKWTGRIADAIRLELGAVG